MADGPPQFPGFQQYAVLTLKFPSGKDRATLSLEGPKLPGVGASATIGIGRDKDGNYHVLIGSGERVYRPADMPAEIRKMFGDSGGGTSGAPVTPGPPRMEMPMPPRDQLQRADGSFMTFDQYQVNRNINHRPGLPGVITVWPELTPDMYQLLIDSYSGGELRPLPPPPKDYGDFPLPPDDTSVA